MARLCDPDINMITLDGCESPEPAIRDMVVAYYISGGLSRNKAFDAMIELLTKHDELLQEILPGYNGA